MRIHIVTIVIQKNHISESKTQSSFIEFECPLEVDFVETKLQDALLLKSKSIIFLTLHMLGLLNLLNRFDFYKEQPPDQCILMSRISQLNVESLPTLEKISDTLIMELDEHFIH